MNWLDLSAALPTVGTAGGLLVLIGVLMRLWLTSEARASREITRINQSHDAELVELRTQLDQCRQRSELLQERLDTERERRRQAEDQTGEAPPPPPSPTDGATA